MAMGLLRTVVPVITIMFSHLISSLNCGSIGMKEKD
jgi:hypothetical protein